MAYTLSMARSYIRLFARNAQSSAAYTDQQVDFALQTAVDKLVRETCLLTRIDAITLTSGSNILPAMPDNFRPDRIEQIYLSSSNAQVNPGYLDPDFSYNTVGAPFFYDGLPNTVGLSICTYQNLLDHQQAYAQNSQPTMVAFNARTGTGLCWPIPDQNYTATIVWNELFTKWPAGLQGVFSTSNTYTMGDVVVTGTASPYTAYQSLIANNATNSVNTTAAWLTIGTTSQSTPVSLTFNVVDDYLTECFAYGAGSLMQLTEPENRYAALAQEKFTDFINSMRGKGNLGVQSIQIGSRGALSGGGYGGGY